MDLSLFIWQCDDDWLKPRNSLWVNLHRNYLTETKNPEKCQMHSSYRQMCSNDKSELGPDLSFVSLQTEHEKLVAQQRPFLCIGFHVIF